VGTRLHVKKGDTVLVISGKNKGKRGKVLRVDTGDERILVEGVNMVKKHQKPTQKVMQGGIIEKEAPIAASAAMLYCPKCGRPARVGHKDLEGGKKVRICARCGEVLDK
jgi:large subunit ribosomal protein L24